MHRLAGALVMSDTCSTARATKRLVVASVAQAVQKNFTEEEWNDMTLEERHAATHA